MGHLRDNHVMVEAVRLPAGVGRRDGDGPSECAQVHGDCVVGHADHDAFLGAHTVVRSAHTWDKWRHVSLVTAGTDNSVTSVPQRLGYHWNQGMSPRAGPIRSTQGVCSLQMFICMFLDFLEVYTSLPSIVSITLFITPKPNISELPCTVYLQVFIQYFLDVQTLSLTAASSSRYSFHYTTKGWSQVQVLLFLN